MAEKRSVPAALGILIGPAIAYISYLILVSGLSEFLQFLCFSLFMLAAFDLAKSRISLSGVLTLLLLPAIPIAMYLNQASAPVQNQLSPTTIIVFWVASALLGAILAGLRPPMPDCPVYVRRLVVVALGSLAIIAASFVL
jgi:hypothetical protein